jgi:hypothetical protein
MKLKFGIVLALLVLVISGCAPKKTYDTEGDGGSTVDDASVVVSFEGTILKSVEVSSGPKLLVVEGDVKDEADYGKSPITLTQQSTYTMYWIKVDSLEGFEAKQKVIVKSTEKATGQNPFQLAKETTTVEVKK